MFSYGSFSELTFSGNRSATRTFNGKTIGVILRVQQDPRIILKVLKIEPPETDGIILYIKQKKLVDLKVIEIESPRFIYEITLQLNKLQGLEF
jgi:hypothetical protein